jgi:hypothetical protein
VSLPIRPSQGLRLCLTLITLAIAFAAAAPAHAARSMDIGIADDRVLLKGTDAEATAAVEQWQKLGIDTVRIHAVWGTIAPDNKAKKMPAGFDPRDPNDLHYNFGPLDRAIHLVTSRGMKVLLVPTGYGPVWGSSEPGKGKGQWKPDPAKFTAFATALARRFGDRVDQYIIWNEPNQPLWLQPQAVCKGKRCTTFAPHLYRRIVLKAGPAIRSADPGAKIIVGALAPRGQNVTKTNSKIRPLQFMRDMGCVNSRYKRVRSGDCRGFSAPVVDGFAYHPNGITLGPTVKSRHPDDAQIADLGRLVHALDGVTKAGGLKPRTGKRLNFWFDEYDYQTSPPDPFAGVKLSTQNAWLQQAASMAWASSRVTNLTQYVWEDEPYRKGGAGNQGGLRFINGKAKPSLAGFRAPFVPTRRNRTTVRLWGQVRPGGRTTVTLQRKSGGRWKTIAKMGTDAWGGFRRDVRIRGKQTFRYTWPGGTSNARSVGA